MYTSFFGFKEKPFNLTPDPRYLFLSTYHKEALDHLLYGIGERKGFIAITGGIGTGKTTLCRSLLDHLGRSVKTALIFNAYLSDMELLKTINQEFGIEMGATDSSKKDYIDALNKFLLTTFANGGNAVLLIDECQNLSNSVLEQIRMLSNLETEKEKLIQIILIGQPELKDLLATPSLRQLNDRIAVRYHLRALDYRDIQGYIRHRLTVAGDRGSLKFTNNTIKKIYAYSRGNPRRINAVCDRALVIAYVMGKTVISRNIIKKAITDLCGTVSVKWPPMAWNEKRFFPISIFLFLLIMTAGIAGWHFKDQISCLLKNKIDAHSSTNTPDNFLEPSKKQASLFIDAKTSLAGLFHLFETNTSLNNDKGINKHNLLLSFFSVRPGYYSILKKPFRIHLDRLTLSSSTYSPYLLISKITPDHAVAIDSNGNEQHVTRDFVLKHWGQKISFLFPLKNKGINLVKGMTGPDVLKVQRALKRAGYSINLTGIYDEATYQGLVMFQKDFGLLPDGIIGLRTMALLYQISD